MNRTSNPLHERLPKRALACLLALCLAAGLSLPAAAEATESGGKQATADQAEQPSSPTPSAASSETSQLADTATDIASGTAQTCIWTIDAAGTLTIAPTSGTDGMMPPMYDSTSIPWKDNKADVKKVVVTAGVKTDYSASGLFSGLANCTEIDLSELDTSIANNMSALFSGCSSLTKLTLGTGFTTANATEIPGISGMFDGCKKLTEVDVSGFDTSKVTNMNNLFANMESLEKVTFGGKFNTSKVTTMGGMFTNCSSLTSLDLSSFNTGVATDIEGMFKGCSSLTSLDLSNFTNPSATNMMSLFEGCAKLESIVFGTNFSTAAVKKMNNMFKGCSSLTSLDVSKLNTAKTKDMLGMFEGCSALTSLDLSSFDTSAVTDMDKMFSGCTSLTALDLSGFDTAELSYTSSMFNGCNLGLNTSFFTSNMNASKIYFYGKDSKDDLANTDFAGDEEYAVYQPYAIAKNATSNGSIVVSSKTSDEDAQAYFTKTAPLYTTGAPTYDSTKGYAQKGQTVTIQLTPEAGYATNEVTVTAAGGSTVFTKGSGDTRTFIMPAEGVGVTATFKRVVLSDVAASNITETSATVSYTPSSDGTLYWLVNPAAEPSVSQIKTEGKSLAVRAEASTLTVDNLAPGTQQVVYLLLVDGDLGAASPMEKVAFETVRSAPNITLADLGIDYLKETFQLPGGMEAYTNPDDIENSKVGSDTERAAIEPGQTIYVRYYAVSVDGKLRPESAGTAITIPGRPATPTAKSYEVADTSITVTDAAEGEQFVLCVKGGTPDWSTANSTGIFTELNPRTEYTVHARVSAMADKSFASEESSEKVTTFVTAPSPTKTGAGAGEANNTADKPAITHDTVSYQGTYTKDYTPTLILNGTAFAPTMIWNPDTQSGSWSYEYTLQPNDTTINAEALFNSRAITAISASDSQLFADDAANTSTDALSAWLNGAQQVEATHDNLTQEATAATYHTADTFKVTGKDYRFTASVGKVTDSLTLTVKPVTATVTAPPDITKTKNTANGLTQAQLGLAEQVEVTYGGSGYIARTETMAVAWQDANLPADFGKTPTEKTFQGTIALPAWATSAAGNAVAATVKIVDQTPLADDQMTFTLPGWGYGEATSPSPTGSITPADTNGTYTYTYSTDGGTTWLTADQLPTSTSGHIIAGTYTAKMYYEGNTYAGSKTATFTVEPKELTLSAGTLDAKSKPYDGTTDAAVSGTPALAGAFSRDLVAPSSFTATYASAAAGTSIEVSVDSFTLNGADSANYFVAPDVSLTLSGSITPADGRNNPAYAQTLALLESVHIVTNITPTLDDVQLPAHWSFTGSTAVTLAARDDTKTQRFPVIYTSQDANYADVAFEHPFPVSSVTLDVEGGLDMRTINGIGSTLVLNPVKLKVVGAALPQTGPWAPDNMEWTSSCPSIIDIAGDAIGTGELSATITGKAEGVSLAGISYRNDATMLGYVLVKVQDAREGSGNSIADLSEITDTLGKLIDPDHPSPTDRAAVNAVADEMTNLPADVKQNLTEQDVKQLDELKQLVNKDLIVHIVEGAQGVSLQPTAVQVVGAAIASGADSGTVKVLVTSVPPTDAKAMLELSLKMTVDESKQQLQSPLFFTMTLPSEVDVAKLTLKHLMDDGTTETVAFVADDQTISFKLDSFSKVQFLISGGEGEGAGAGSNAPTGTVPDGSTPAKLAATGDSGLIFLLAAAGGLALFVGGLALGKTYSSQRKRWGER